MAIPSNNAVPRMLMSAGGEKSTELPQWDVKGFRTSARLEISWQNPRRDKPLGDDLYDRAIKKMTEVVSEQLLVVFDPEETDLWKSQLHVTTRLSYEIPVGKKFESILGKLVSAVRQEGRTHTRVKLEMPPTPGGDTYLIYNY
jgi:hypothetical protein